MKLHIAPLSAAAVDGKALVLSGSAGAVRLGLYEPLTVRIAYEFSALPDDPDREELLEHLAPGLAGPGPFGPGLTEKAWDSVREENAAYHLVSGGLEVVVEKDSGYVSVIEEGRLVHGGRVGTNDTVLPRYPLRVVSPARVPEGAAGAAKSGNAGTAKGKFIFPLSEDDRFFGVGDKTGPLNHRGRRFKMGNRDALGYDAGNSDPLYKSVPFFLRWNRAEGRLAGLYFPVPEVEEIDFGVESLFYYSVTVLNGPFEYFVFPGGSYASVLDRYTRVTGRPALPPLFTFGFFGSSMNYVDPEDAEERVLGYFDRVEREKLPCEGMYFSSGYVKAENGERYAFEWNRKKFPDPAAFIGRLAKRGYRICFNLKPGILVTHPKYRSLERRKFLVRDAGGAAYREYYWGNDAAFFDFRNPEAYAWWKDAVTETFLNLGAAGIWNDNNEFEIEDEGVPARRLRSVYPLLMMKASREAFLEARPGKRPWVISRSGYAGMQRYGRTWTGDNVSDYRTLAYNTFQGLSLGLSGIPFYGHDVGGFFGPFPDPELFLRFCQAAVFQPRFVIHSWKPGEGPVEPWSFPAISGEVRDLIRLHYEFVPYIYNAALEACETGLPPERPLCLEFPDDPAVDPDDFAHLFGRSIYKVPVFRPGMREAEIYLPAGPAWYDPERKVLHRGGRRIVVETPLRGVRYLVRAGSVVPASPGLSNLASGFFPLVEFRLYPGGDFRFLYREDDGESEAPEPVRGEYEISVSAGGRMDFRVLRRPPSPNGEPRRFRFVLPEGFRFGRPETGHPAGTEERVLEVTAGEEGPQVFSVAFSGRYEQGE